MDDLLKPVSTAYKANKQEEVFLTEVSAPLPTIRPIECRISAPSNPEEALKALKSKPDFTSLAAVLKYLVQTADINLHQPSPLGSQIINVLVSDVVPNYWSLLSERKRGKGGWSHIKEQSQLLEALKNVSGLGAIAAKLKALLEENRRTAKKVDGLNNFIIIKDYIELLGALLKDEETLRNLYLKLSNGPCGLQHALWQELVAFVGGGRVLSVAAEAQSVLKEASKDVENYAWIADPLRYSTWIGKNLATWASQLPISGDEGAWHALSAMLRKSMRLGYPDTIQGSLIDLGIGGQAVVNRVLLNGMAANEQKLFISGTIRLLNKRYLSAEENATGFEWWKSNSTSVAAVAAFLQAMIDGSASRTDVLISWLTSLNGSGVGEGVGIRRSVIAVVAMDEHKMEQVLEKSMQQFGDQLYIKHTPSLQQDVHTQTLLLAAGYVQRLSPLKLKMLTRSSLYLNAVSNRLASSSDRARFLGMIVGEAISGLAETAGKQMDFKMEELQSGEAEWYKSLVNVRDSIGSVADLRVKAMNENSEAKPLKFTMAPSLRGDERPSARSQPTIKLISIEEIDDKSENEDDNIMTYGKPDSDAEDSDDDPTLLTRNTFTAPVYIRDLISYFRDFENYDKQKLALATAPGLIRRKANFGTEVKDHVEELASLLMGLQDKYDIDNFNKLRIQSMIAILLSDPEKMGKWYAKTFFDGDYSVSQRASVLSTITMAARELGGHPEEKSLTAAQSSPEPVFPSQRLPARMETIWQPNAVDALAEKMSKAMIQPLAAEVADQATGPNILKVRTFSSRLAVESRRAVPTVNKLAKIIADSFFFPLTGRFFAYLKTYGGKSVIFESYLLSSFVKTLSLLLHASGTNTFQLPQMTREFWDLLLALRSHTVGDKAVGEAVLFGFMTILELNQDQKQLAEQHGREMLETQRWVEALFGTLGEGEEEERSKTLAAGVLLRLSRVVQKYQALLMGDLASF